MLTTRLPFSRETNLAIMLDLCVTVRACVPLCVFQDGSGMVDYRELVKGCAKLVHDGACTA